MRETPARYQDEKKADTNKAWQVADVSGMLKRRREAESMPSRAIDLRLALDELEDRYGISSSVAMKHILAGTLQFPAWERMHNEYRELAKKGAHYR